MIIENPEALKLWLTSCLGRLCDADPAALAKYVIALVKKDKPENELKEFCSDQLEVFLVKETKPFVEILFETLSSKSYLQNSQTTFPHNNTMIVPVNVNVPTSLTVAFNGNTENVKEKATSSCMLIETTEDLFVPTQRGSQENKRLSHVNERDSQVSLTPTTLSQVESYARESSQDSLIHQSRSSPLTRSRSRDRIEKDQRLHGASIFAKHEDRNREIYIERRRVLRERQRTHSLSRSRSSSLDSNSSHSRSSSWSRTKKDICTGKSRSTLKSLRNKDDSTHHQSSHGDTDYRLAPNVREREDSSICPSPHKVAKKHVKQMSMRCHDFDEKGYCMLGDLCIYDHGVDPLIVDDMSVLGGALDKQAVSVSPLNCMPSIVLSPHAGTESPVPPPLPPSSPPPQPPPPPPPPLPQQSPFGPEQYNPEAPGLFSGKAEKNTSFSPSILPYWSSSGLQEPPCSLTAGLLSVPPFNPSTPPPTVFHTNPKAQRPRELIGVPTNNTTLESKCTESLSSSDIFVTCNQEMASMQRGKTNTTNATNTVFSVGPISGENYIRKKTLGGFDYSRLGKKPVKRNQRCVLEIRKVPVHLNTISHLNSHFSKFGIVKQVEVQYDDDPEAALIQFSTHVEATAAYRSSEPVLNNRFIKVFWHKNKETEGDLLPQKRANTNEASEEDNIKTSLFCTSYGNKSLTLSPAKNVSDLRFKIDNLAHITQVEEAPNTHIVPTVQSGRGESVPRPTFNPAALKKSNITAISKPAIVMKHKEETMQKQLDLYKKKQAFLQTYLENQTVLIQKLEKCKNEKERESVKEVIETIQQKIAHLQADMKKDFSEEFEKTKISNGTLGTTKTEAEKQLLDTEMDIYKKQSKGEDITTLLWKAKELRKTSLCAFRLATSKARDIARSAQRNSRPFHALRGNRGTSHRSIDRRTRKIIVMDSTEEEISKDELKDHFQQFGHVENIESRICDNVAAVCVEFRTRNEAELAFNLGTKCGQHTLKMSWCHDIPLCKQSLKTHEDKVQLEEINTQKTQAVEEEEEEEEDEDSEARSWRR